MLTDIVIKINSTSYTTQQTERSHLLGSYLLLGSIKEFCVGSHDDSQEYLQSSELLPRKVYIRPPPEVKPPKGSIILLLKLLHGLPDSGEYFNRTMSHHQAEDLEMISSYAHPAL